MKSTFRILFYLKRNGQKANGNMPIMGRITVNGQAVQFGAKVEIKPDYWNVKAGKAIGKASGVQEVNAILESIKTTMSKIYRDLQERETKVTPERIKNRFFGIEVRHEMLLELFKRHNEDVFKLIGISKSKSTYQKYEITRKHLSSFLKQRYNIPDIFLKEINHMFLSDFEVYLLTTCGCNANTTAKFMQFFKRIIIIAKNNGWIYTDPFANYKIRIATVDRGYLTQEQLEVILEKKFASRRLDLVRDIFVFSCYTGLAYIDVKNLRQKHIRTSFDGNLWVMTKRQKTNVQSNIPLLDEAKQILEKYRDTLPDEKVLPILSNQKMNAYLKEIGDLCGIEQNLTFHLARHTFGTTVTLAKGVPIETVSKMLGHTNIKTTQIYARITNSKIGIDMAVLSEKMKSMKTKQVKQKSEIDSAFECLPLEQKLDLFNMPNTLSDGTGIEKRIIDIWYHFSEQEKHTYSEKIFSNMPRLRKGMCAAYAAK